VPGGGGAGRRPPGAMAPADEQQYAEPPITPPTVPAPPPLPSSLPVALENVPGGLDQRRAPGGSLGGGSSQARKKNAASFNKANAERMEAVCHDYALRVGYAGPPARPPGRSRMSVVTAVNQIKKNAAVRRQTARVTKRTRFSSRVIPNSWMDTPNVTEMVLQDETLVDSIGFEAAVGCIVFLNVLLVGIEADHGCWACPRADRMAWFAVDNVFTVLFLLEMGLRIACLGPVTYFLGDELSNPLGFAACNTIDFCLVLARMIDTWVLSVLDIDLKLKILSCFRICQLVTFVKHVKMNASFQELRLMVAGVLDCAKALLRVALLTILLGWVTGIVLTVSIGQNDDTVFDFTSSPWSQDDYFGTVPRSMLSMFQILTRDKWSSSITRPALDAYPFAVLIIFVFMSVAWLLLTNIFIGVVIESTLAIAKLNREHQANELVKLHAKVMESLREVFEEADVDKSGTLDQEELHRAMKTPAVRDRMKLLDIPISDLHALFHLLDDGGTGQIRTVQFFRSCSRLQGGASALDLHHLAIDVNRYSTWCDHLVGQVEETSRRISSLLEDVCCVDRDIIKSEADEKDPVLINRRHRARRHVERGSRNRSRDKANGECDAEGR